MPEIVVNEKALAHLSRGLYRSPGSAIRELVSNAWDAGATLVRVNTSYPTFTQLSVQDNGDGFSREDFDRLMKGGIGNSEKRVDPQPLPFGRPLIGRLGIGMLGIAQICPSFTVASKARNGESFRAKVRLYDLLKERLDKDDELIVKTKEVHVGTYDFYDSGPDISHGTLIIGDDIHPNFTKAFRDSLTFEKFTRPSLEWSKDVKVLERVRSLQEMGDYWRLLWEISASCPIPYLSASALPEGVVKEEHKKLESYHFKVMADGIVLSKPVWLRGNPAGYTVELIGPEEKIVYGKTVSYHGYIIVQEGVQIRPDEMRGILIRINNVGIGYYDGTMLDYRWNEGPRSRWLTGEVFVTSGLEDALNIDRDSFNRFHPEFRAVQEAVHKVLKTKIFPQVYKQIKVRSDRKKEEKARARSTHLARILSTELNRRVSIKSPGTSNQEKVKVVPSGDRVSVALPSAETLHTKRTYQSLAAAVLAVFETAIRKQSKEQQRDTFKELLLDLLSRW
jgi:hypothetical protein